MVTSTCPYCSNPLLRHVRSKGVYWFCNHCYQEMPYPNRSLDHLETTLNLSYYSSLIKTTIAQQTTLV